MGPSFYAKHLEITLMIPILVMFSCGAIFLSIMNLIFLPIDYYQSLNILSLVYNLYIVFGCVKMNEKALRAAEAIAIMKFACIILLALFVPIVVSCYVSSGVLQSTPSAQLDVQKDLQTFLNNDVGKKPFGLRQALHFLIDYILLNAAKVKTAEANFEFALDTGFLIEAIFLFCAALIFIDFGLIHHVRRCITKEKLEPTEEKLMDF